MLTATRLKNVRSARNDTGMTLVELMVGMGLVTLLGGLCLVFFVGSTQQANRVGEQSLTDADLRVAVENIANELRLADTPTARPGFAAGRFEVVAANRVVFYANLDAASRTGTAARTPPTKVDIYVDTDGSLRQKIYRPKSTTYPANYPDNYASTPSSTAILVRAVANPTAVFGYCTSLTDPTTTGCTATTNPLAVASVNVTLTVAGAAGSAAQSVQTNAAITGAVS